MNKFIRTITLAMTIFLLSPAYGQVIKGFEIMEIIKIAEFNRTAENLSFSVTYKYTDNASPGNVLEQMDGNYKLQGGKYKMQLGDVEYVQGNLYNLTVFRDDSTIVVNERTIASKLLQMPLLDSMFRISNIDSMHVTTINDSVNRLTMFFKPNAYYAGYEMEYDKNQYRIYNIIYKLREVAEDDNNPNPSGIARVTMTFSGYSTGRVDPEEFNEDKYIYRTGSSFYARPPYENFRLVINVGN